MRELRVEDALIYLDHVKMEFGDRPHIYNEFLDIMKTFKTQQIDTPGVIRRVSTLFQGNKKLVLGFNTFLPEGYKIELPLDGEGPPVAVYRAPGQPGVTHILGGPAPAGGAPPVPPPGVQHAAVATAAQTGQPSAAQRGLAQGPQQGPPQQGVASAMQSSQPMARPHMDQQAGRPGPPEFLKPPHSQQSQPPSVLQQSLPPQQQPSPQKPPARSVGVQPHALPQQQQPQQQQGLPPQQQQQMGQVETQPKGKAKQPESGGDTQILAAAPPVEFDHAINYVTTIKRRFAGEPDTYKKFLEILHTYQKEQRGIEEVLDEVSLLFADHPDLLKEFTYFLPDAVQAEAKAQLDQVAKEAEARNRAKASKKAIMQQAQGMQQQTLQQQQQQHQQQRQRSSQYSPAAGATPTAGSQAAPIPFGATQGRSVDRERELARNVIHGTVSFAPVRPPPKNENSATQATGQKGRPHTIPELPVQPTTAEVAFFERVKLHLSRKELAPDKPPGSRRHTPYVEFLKCLHLFGSGIFSKDELLMVLRGLFMQGHAPKSGANAGGGATNPTIANDAQELCREFEEILVGRGHFANQEENLKTKSKYGDKQVRDMDFSGCEKPTPSYRTYPADYPAHKFLFFSGQSGMDASVLNNEVVCVPEKRNRIWSPEDYDGPSERHNPYEEALFKVEEDRFETDMAIERNFVAMRQVEPIAEEVTKLREEEEKDGQPIGRMHYKLRSRQLNNAQINAIARVYGDSGDEVLQYLVRNPVAVLPIVYHRLRQKDAEWRKVRNDMNKKWSAVHESNFEGSLDATCWFQKRDLERLFEERKLVKQVKNARVFVREPSIFASRRATADYFPKALMGSTERDNLVYQPHLQIHLSPSMPHKDAYKLISRRLSKRPKDERERSLRIWAEFMVPLFGLPTHWIWSELVGGGDKRCSSIVKYAVGQRVVTCLGRGEILAVVEGGAAGTRYKIRFSFGIGFIRPQSIVHLTPGHGRFVRSGGRMKVSDLEFEESAHHLPKRYKLLFTEEKVYKFIRMYCLLVQILADTRQRLKGASAMEIEHHDRETIPSKEAKTKQKIYDYPSYLATLRKNVTIAPLDTNQALEWERFCRKTCKGKVAQLTVIPKLVEKCSNLMVDISKDDVLLTCWDYAMMRHNRDPVKLRSQCLSVSDGCCYRVQVDDKNVLFSYVDSDADLMALPEEEDDEDDTMNYERENREIKRQIVRDEGRRVEEPDLKRQRLK